MTFSIADSQEYKKTRKSFKILSIDTREVSILEVMKPEIKSLASKDLVPCSSVLQSTEEQRTVVDLTHFSKDKDVHSPLKKRSKVFDSEGIIMGNELSDNEINLAQQLLKEQYNKLNGLQSTLLQSKQLKQDKE